MVERVNPDRTRCSFYLPHKRRFCRRQLAQAGPAALVTFCSEHDPSAVQGQGASRVPCPFDPKHTVLKKSLERHLRKCPARPKPKPAFHTDHANASHCGRGHTLAAEEVEEVGEGVEDGPTLYGVPVARIHALIARIRAAYAADLAEHGEPPLEMLGHPSLSAQIEALKAQGSACKHLEQQASLVAHMEQSGLLQAGACFVEFGAGKGKLLQSIGGALGPDTPATLLAIDRDTYRRKAELSLQDRAHLRHGRIRIDIEHLVLDRVPIVAESLGGGGADGGADDGGAEPPASSGVVACGKHLCGVATDLTLNCLLNFEHGQAAAAGAPEEGQHATKRPRLARRVRGLTIAQCCHHICDWARYSNQEFFVSRGFSAGDFRLLSTMCSWATCGSRKSRRAAQNRDKAEHGVEEEEEHQHAAVELGPEVRAGADPAKRLSTSDKLGLDRDRQRRVGLMCKHLINAGRRDLLKECGMDACLKRYIDLDHSLENIVLIATCPGA